MKRKITFKDKDKNIFNVDVEIIEGRFSARGDYGGGCGQCLDHIKPKNKHQKKLIDLWHKYHLNDMNAGTKEQEKAIEEAIKEKKLENYDYEKVCTYLKSIKLYEVIYYGKPYKYGHGWLKRRLPSNIEEETNAICNNIEKIEQEEKGEILVSKLEDMTEEEIGKLEIEVYDFSDEIFALAIHLELTIDELEEIEEDGTNRYIYGGINYYVGTEDELYDIAKESLEGNEMWKMAVEADSTTKSEEEWIEEVLNMDGIGHTLNGWDGSDHIQQYNETDYTICRQ